MHKGSDTKDIRREIDTLAEEMKQNYIDFLEQRNGRNTSTYTVFLLSFPFPLNRIEYIFAITYSFRILLVNGETVYGIVSFLVTRYIDLTSKIKLAIF